MSLSEKEAQIIQCGIEGAMGEAKDAKQCAQAAASQIAELRARVQELMDRPGPPAVCPHCGGALGHSH